MRTVLIGHPGVSWRAWLTQNRLKNELICLDPGDPQQPCPGKLTFFKGPRPKAWRFYGSLDPNRAPHVLVGALSKLLSVAGQDVFIQFPDYRPGPLARQTALMLAEVCQPDRILVAQGSGLDGNGFTIGPEEVELEAAFPPLVEAAQRKARWLRFFDSATEQQIDLSRVATEGARFGSGRRMTPAELAAHLPTADHAEVCGSALFVVTDSPPDEDEVGRVLNTFHCSRLHLAAPGDYSGLLCSFARGVGEDFAFGVIRSVDFRRQLALVVSDAVPPAPVSLLRIGSLRVDANGNERGETRPWSV